MTNLDAVGRFNMTMLVREVLQAYRITCENRKDTHRNLRLRDMALRIAEFNEKTGRQLTKPLPKLTRKEATFLAVFQTRLYDMTPVRRTACTKNLMADETELINYYADPALVITAQREAQEPVEPIRCEACGYVAASTEETHACGGVQAHEEARLEW